MNRPTLTRLKALVITDEAERGNAWAAPLKSIGIDIVMASTGDDAVEVWATELPDLILLEDFDPHDEELEICRKLRVESPVPILLLTNKNDEDFQLRAYRSGIDECIAQPISPSLFLAKVRAWLRRAQSLPSSTVDAVQAGGYRLEARRRWLYLPGGGGVKLTNLEVGLLYVLMNQPGRAMEASTLIERVWGSYGGGDNVMLKNVVYRLRRKLEPDPAQPQHLVTEGSGYKLII